MHLSVDLFPDTPAPILEQEWLKAVIEHLKTAEQSAGSVFLPQSLKPCLEHLAWKVLSVSTGFPKRPAQAPRCALKIYPLNVVARGAGMKLTTGGWT